MKSNWPIIVCLFLGLATICPESLRAQSGCQDFLQRMNQIHRDNFYTNYRDLADYTQFLGLDFDSALAALRPHEIWLDAGAGAGVALQEYLNLYPQGGKVVGLGITYPTQDALQRPWPRPLELANPAEQRLAYVEGYLEDLPRQKLQVFGTHYQLITDVFGPMMYSPYPDQVLQIYGELLAPDGMVMLLIDMHNLHLVDSSMATLAVQDWFLKMEGLELVEDPMIFQERTAEIFLAVILRRTYALLKIPPLQPLWPYFRVGCPPGRCYRLDD